MRSNLVQLALTFLLAFASVACRQDMHNQPRYKPLAESSFFSDRRSERPQVEGTIARGHLRLDRARYSGKIGEIDIDAFPFPIAKADLVRGQERFNIYCSPCHSRIGDGYGLVVMRGFHPPPSYYVDRLKQAPVGHFFDVMTNGFGAMASYASRVAPDDRWRIAAYIRALQLSESASINDVPTDQRQNLPVEPPPNGLLPGQADEKPANPARDMPTPLPAQGEPNPPLGSAPARPAPVIPTRGANPQTGTSPRH